MNFLELGLSEQTVRAIEEFGIQEPTTVQSDVIPSILEGKDVFTIAPQGCGKTMSYVFPLVDIISTKGAQNILIITPNSEQSVITSDRLAIFNKYHSINEATIKDGEEDIDNEANVIIGSPDLLVEIVENGKIDLSKTNILVVDDIRKTNSWTTWKKFWQCFLRKNRTLSTPTDAPGKRRKCWKKSCRRRKKSKSTRPKSRRPKLPPTPQRQNRRTVIKTTIKCSRRFWIRKRWNCQKNAILLPAEPLLSFWLKALSSKTKKNKNRVHIKKIPLIRRDFFYVLPRVAVYTTFRRFAAIGFVQLMQLIAVWLEIANLARTER